MIRRQICGIVQESDESLHAYWERFERLCAGCPRHGIPEHVLIHFFYDGLSNQHKLTFDVASGGSFMNLTHQDAKLKLETLASNSRNYGQMSEPTEKVNENTYQHCMRCRCNETTLSDIVRRHDENIVKLQEQSTENHKQAILRLQSLEAQVEQLATLLVKLESRDKLPSGSIIESDAGTVMQSPLNGKVMMGIISSGPLSKYF